MAVPATVATSIRLGDLLLAEGLCTPEQVQRAVAEGRQSGLKVGSALVKLGFVTRWT